jgi:alpha-tubulin suppressor-like RCC1 family protein
MKKITLLFVAITFLVINSIYAQTISAGAFCSFAVCSDNTVKAWGWNSGGQLGDNTTIDRLTPVQVNGLAGVIKIACGGSHSLALKNDGTVWAWGSNGSGQLGDNTIVDRHSPVQVLGLTEIVAIACGESHSFAVKNDGSLWAWGDNTEGKLGDSTNVDRHVPVLVHGLTGIIAVDGGAFHSLALRIDGTVWAWGSNYEGEAGNSDSINVENWIPVQVSMSNVKAIACGSYFCLALKNDSTLWGWGEDSAGELGDSIHTYYGDAYIPIPVSQISGITSVGTGAMHTLVVKNNGTAWSCGYNSSGQLGMGSAALDTALLVQMVGLTNVISVTSEAWHSLVLESNGTLWTCGSNNNGELGNGTTSPNANPTPGQVISLCSVLVPSNNCSSNYTLLPDTSQLHTYFIISNSAGTPPLRHLWSWGDGNYDTIPYPNHTYADTGYYTICHSVFDAAGCSSVYCNSSNLQILPLQMVTVNVVTSIPNGIEDHRLASEVLIFSNPVVNELRIENSELRIKEIEIYNVLGEKCLTPPLSKGEGVRVDVSLLPAGIYFLKVRGEKEDRVAKFVKQ